MIQRMSLFILCLLAVSTRAGAQNWSFDARAIALGSPGGGENLASTMIDDARDYRAIVLPFGLIQVFRDFKTLNPSNDEFDVVRSIEYAASPLHYTIGRDSSDSKGDAFVIDVGNGELSRDLNDYKGFIPVNQPAAEGLASPNWGKTFKVRTGAGGSFQGVYAGAGPYVSMRTAPVIDPRLTDIFGAAQPVYVPNARLTAENVTQGQIALAVTGGYRGRFAWPAGVGGGTGREGLYVAANVSHLRGFRYEDIGFRMRLDTDARGLLTVNRSLPAPLLVSRTAATSGTGMAVDVGVGAVVNHWELGVGANGIANRIDWTGVERTTYFHTDLLTGSGDLTEGATVPLGDVRVELPVNYRAHVAYDVDRWAWVAEFGRGFQGTSFHGGGEYRVRSMALRGGAVYSRELWNPAGGMGIDMSRHVSLDVAVYGNAANVERKRRPAVAFSLRLNH